MLEALEGCPCPPAARSAPGLRTPCLLAGRPSCPMWDPTYLRPTLATEWLTGSWCLTAVSLAARVPHSQPRLPVPRQGAVLHCQLGWMSPGVCNPLSHTGKAPPSVTSSGSPCTECCGLTGHVF